jgi:hypothetical protein
MTTWVSRAPRPRLASQPRSRHAVKFAESFAVAFPARASPGVVTQRLGLQARTKKRGKAKPGRIRKREERKSAQWGPPRPRGSSSPSRLYLSEAGSLAPRRPCLLPFPSHAARFPSPLPLKPSSWVLLLPPPSLRQACLLPPPPREASLRPDPEEDVSPSRAVITAPRLCCHRAPPPCALGPRVC